MTLSLGLCLQYFWPLSKVAMPRYGCHAVKLQRPHHWFLEARWGCCEWAAEEHCLGDPWRLLSQQWKKLRWCSEWHNSKSPGLSLSFSHFLQLSLRQPGTVHQWMPSPLPAISNQLWISRHPLKSLWQSLQIWTYLISCSSLGGRSYFPYLWCRSWNRDLRLTQI